MIRRAFYYWQFAAVVVLPAWLVIGWPIFGAGGWKVLGVFFGAVLLGTWLLAVAALYFARRSVRSQRALSWPNVGALTIWHALIVAIGFYAESAPMLSVIAILAGIGATWLGIWELYVAARRRVNAAMEEIDQAARGAYGQAASGDDSATGARHPRIPGSRNSRSKVIVVAEKPHRR
ncbi:MAG: hypothetical protein JWQ68_2183 [Cryobacterium sp.]|nr:hypothetical protein [Cryobacterium sp.]